ncbi:MAG TPA: hypothetical protein VK177_01550 [Flavobacteriales bacterium]|nr:hypothetical protein [Flavobacteriales bacterium]
MKKLFLSLVIVFASSAVMAQKPLVAKIENSKASFIQTETTSTTKFELSASYSQIQDLQNKASQMQTIKFVAVAKTNNVYECQLTATEQNHAEYVHKMFLTLGIESISVDGKESSIEELPQVLTKLK